MLRITGQRIELDLGCDQRGRNEVLYAEIVGGEAVVAVAVAVAVVGWEVLLVACLGRPKRD